MADIRVRGRMVVDAKRGVAGDKDIVSFRFRSDEVRNKGSRDNPDYVDLGNYFDVTVWRKEILDGVASLKKGDRVRIEGRMTTSHWTDGEDQHFDLKIDADEVNPYIRDLESLNYKARKGSKSETSEAAHA